MARVPTGDNDRGGFRATPRSMSESTSDLDTDGTGGAAEVTETADGQAPPRAPALRSSPSSPSPPWSSAPWWAPACSRCPALRHRDRGLRRPSRVIAGAGMLMLAFVFQTLAVRKPHLDAGVYAYAKAGFGEYLGFFRLRLLGQRLRRQRHPLGADRVDPRRHLHLAGRG